MKIYIKAAIANMTDEPEDIKVEIAKSTNSVDVLLHLIDTSNELSFVSQYAASNPNIPAEQLYGLAKSDKVYVRRGVAENPNTPLDILDNLTHDPDDSVRALIARRTDIPSGIINRLHNDSDFYVRSIALKNPNLPESVLWGAIKNKNAKYYYSDIIDNPNITSEMLSLMVELEATYQTCHPIGWQGLYHIMQHPKLHYADLLRLADCGILDYPDIESQYVAKVLSDRPEGYDITDALKNIWEQASSHVCVEIAESPNTPTEFLQYLYENTTNQNILNHAVANLNNRGITV